MTPSDKIELLNACRNEIAETKAEVERLKECLARANEGFEKFERECYLATDKLALRERQLVVAKDALLGNNVLVSIQRALTEIENMEKEK